MVVRADVQVVEAVDALLRKRSTQRNRSAGQTRVLVDVQTGANVGVRQAVVADAKKQSKIQLRKKFMNALQLASADALMPVSVAVLVMEVVVADTLLLRKRANLVVEAAAMLVKDANAANKAKVVAMVVVVVKGKLMTVARMNTSTNDWTNIELCATSCSALKITCNTAKIVSECDLLHLSTEQQQLFCASLLRQQLCHFLTDSVRTGWILSCHETF